MRPSIFDRILGAAFMLLVSAWAASWAVKIILGVLPVLIGIVAVVLGSGLAWRSYRNRDGTGW